MDTLFQDLRYGLRTLLKSPGLTAVAVLALALGIGANTAIFSVVNTVLLRPLPYAEPDRLVIMWEKAQKMDTSVAYLNYRDWESQNSSFEQMTAFRRESFNLTGAGEPERLSGRMVTAGFFATFGVPPARGRDFTAEDDRPGATPVVILSHGFWQRRFAGDESIVGRQLTLSDRSFTVIGIASPDFRFGVTVDLFAPLGLWAERYQQRGMHPGIYVVGRLKPGLNIEQGRGDMDGIMAALGEQYPQSNADRRIHIESLYDNTVQGVRTSLYVLLGAVAFVLLIACANVANLLLAKAATRQKEMALRTALGAGRGRIMRQLLTESTLLSLMGGAAGLVLAVWGTDALISAVPDGVPRLEEIGMDGRVLLFTSAISVLTGLFFGLAPALQAARVNLNDALKEGGRGSTGRRHRVRGALVIAEVALALVLLIGAGLMIRSFWQLQQAHPGFDADGLLTAQLAMSVTPPQAQKARNFIEQLEQKLRALPGARAAALSAGAPFLGASEDSVYVEGDRTDEPGAEKMAVVYATTPAYLQAMGIRLLRGRYFTAQDKQGSQEVAVIDETFARRYFPDQDPIGKRLLNPPAQPGAVIVGVVGHVVHYGLDGQVPVEPQVYYPLYQMPDQIIPFVARNINMLVRAAGDPAALTPAVRQAVREIEPNQPIFNARTMGEVIDTSVADRRFSLLLLLVFAAAALLLATVGIYGVMAYSVAQRTHEIGIRMALGAGRREVLRLVVGQGMALALAGVGVGVAAAFALTRLMSSMLFGVSASDPLTFVAIPALLAVVALAACYLPARRATRVDPMIALRNE